MNGTTAEAASEIRLIPPRHVMNIATAMIAAKTICGTPVASAKATQTVFVAAEGMNKPIPRKEMIAINTP